ncbi:hypothetical protein [Calidithermus terrae]|uniref:hypothetical protein n=1 Tax=Calidithermus terrae TaxID=1408545 RepID=UPI0011C40503|nr:hypothetical protein [Calidithermus terrae]
MKLRSLGLKRRWRVIPVGIVLLFVGVALVQSSANGVLGTKGSLMNTVFCGRYKCKPGEEHGQLYTTIPLERSFGNKHPQIANQSIYAARDQDSIMVALYALIPIVKSVRPEQTKYISDLYQSLLGIGMGKDFLRRCLLAKRDSKGVGEKVLQEGRLANRSGKYKSFILECKLDLSDIPSDPGITNLLELNFLAMP